MRLARYHGGGVVKIENEPTPQCPEGGLLVQTEACGLCSGELMDWYMDRKVPHVFGHEVCGKVLESRTDNFKTGQRIFAHHHAPCLECDLCRAGHTVHCPTWKATKLQPGGMAEQFAVSPANLADTFDVGTMRPQDAALIEPLACVAKSLRRARWTPGDRVAIIGLGVMGLMHALITGGTGIEISPARQEWARGLGIELENQKEYDLVVVCPGSRAAVEKGIELCAPGGRLVLFAPLPPGGPMPLDLEKIYFRDLEIITAYSCGPEDTRQAFQWLGEGLIRAEQVVSHFISLEELPDYYLKMKSGEILKPMVLY